MLTTLDIANLIFGLGSWVFLAGVLPTLFHPHSKVPRITSVLTGTMCAVNGGVYLLLGLDFAAVSIFILSAAWIAVAMFRACPQIRPLEVRQPV